ncbi:hypothetical protein SLE2022_349690 [Rubroshorea leprosula]
MNRDLVPLDPNLNSPTPIVPNFFPNNYLDMSPSFSESSRSSSSAGSINDILYTEDPTFIRSLQISIEEKVRVLVEQTGLNTIYGPNYVYLGQWLHGSLSFVT